MIKKYTLTSNQFSNVNKAHIFSDDSILPLTLHSMITNLTLDHNINLLLDLSNIHY